jgi:hypothetical protein
MAGKTANPGMPGEGPATALHCQVLLVDQVSISWLGRRHRNP